VDLDPGTGQRRVQSILRNGRGRTVRSEVGANHAEAYEQSATRFDELAPRECGAKDIDGFVSFRHGDYLFDIVAAAR
jgi:hypothetical protein